MKETEKVERHSESEMRQKEKVKYERERERDYLCENASEVCGREKKKWRDRKSE